MKMKKQILITVLFFVTLATALAQNTQTNLKIMMNVVNVESAETNSYELENVSYYYSLDYPYKSDTVQAVLEAASVGFNCSIAGESVDNFLLLWIARKPALMDGEIVITDLLTGETIRTITFSEAKITSQSESFLKGASYRYGSDLVLTFKKMKLDGVDIIE